MNPIIKIFVDFNNADSSGRVRLNTKGTDETFKILQIQPKPGLKVLLDDDESLRTTGIIQFSRNENIWVAEIDWTKIEQY
jgi:hypothetical protein